jgi:hypothetical protein
MSTHVEGFIPPDEKFNKMFRAYEACEVAGIRPPKEVTDFFNGVAPDPAGVRISLNYDKKYKDAVTEYNEDDGQGYEIDLTKLPKDIKVIRFTNSW